VQLPISIGVNSVEISQFLGGFREDLYDFIRF
jgi:hypothetical protein